MDDTSPAARYHRYSKPVWGAKESFGWWKIERSLAEEQLTHNSADHPLPNLI